MIATFRCALIASLAVAGAAWGQDTADLSVTPTSLRMQVGGEPRQLVVTVVLSDRTTRPVQAGRAKYFASDSTVASVDSVGRVVARGPGSGTILVSYQSVERIIPVSVSRTSGQTTAPIPGAVTPGAPAPPRPVKSLRISPDQMRLLPTERAHFTISAEFEDGTIGIPSSYSVAVYGTAARLDSASSEVVGIAAGDARLGVRIGSIAQDIPVKVVEASLRIDRDTLALAVGSVDTVVIATNEAQSRQLRTGLLWRSTNRQIILPLDSLSGGVRAVGLGTAQIIVDGYGQTNSLPVVTYTPVVSLRRTGEQRPEFAVPVGLQTTVGAEAVAENGAGVPSAPQRWTVADTNIARYDRGHGMLTARREGSTTLTVRTPNVPAQSWRVRVVDAKFSIVAPPAYLAIGDSRQLRAVWVGPDGDTLRSSSAISWRSSSPRSLAVGDSGRISAAETGLATIRAEAGDRYHADAPVRVTADFLVTLDYGRDSLAVAELSVQKHAVEPIASLSGARFASWTANRDRMVFSRRTGQGKPFALYTAAPDGSDARQISRPRDGDDIQAKWFVQPDHIAYLSGRSGDFRVSAQQIDDTLALTLMVRGRVRGIARRRDRDEFLVIREADSRFAVWVATMSAQEKKLVGDHRGAIDAVTELPDGSLLMVADTSAGKDRFALVRWADGVETSFDAAFQNVGRLRSIAAAADGRHAVVIADHPTAKQGSVVLWIDLATHAVEEILRTDLFKVLAPDA